MQKPLSRLRLAFFFKIGISLWLLFRFLCPVLLNELRLGFSAFEVKVLDEHILCMESIHSVSLSHF